MDFFVFVIVVLSIVFGFVLVLRFVKPGPGFSDRHAGALRQEVAALRERIEALEAIVTDGRRTLAQEIDALEPRSGASRGR